MDAASDARTRRRPWSETHLARGLLFLGIVWSIAGTFLVLQNGLVSLSAHGIGIGIIPPELASSSAMREEAARRCGDPWTQGAGSGARTAAESAALQRAALDAYRMGRGFGITAGSVFSGLSRPTDGGSALLQEVRGQAIALGVPPPELPTIRYTATALSEFADAVQADRQCTAARLAGQYTPRHGHLYNLGVMIGYAALFCMNDVCGAHGPEIRRYGQATGVPEWIWLPMATGSLAAVPGTDAKQKTSVVLGALDEHIRTGHWDAAQAEPRNR